MNSADPSYMLLTLLAAQLDDIEASRKAAENRCRAFELKGLVETPEAALFGHVRDQLKRIEKDAISSLEQTLRSHPMAAFVTLHKGVGLKGIARLLGTVGDPLWNDAEERSRRGPAELWAYCGYHTIPAGDHSCPESQHLGVPGGNVRPRRRRGVRCNWNTRAKTAVYVVAESAYRQGHYRPLYVAERERAATKTHAATCRNQVRPPGRPNGCGTVAHPEWGEPGSPWRPGHQHQHAISMVSKQILLDLFVMAKEIDA